MSDDDKASDLTIGDIRELVRETMRDVLMEVIGPKQRKRRIVPPSETPTEETMDRVKRALKRAGKAA